MMKAVGSHRVVGRATVQRFLFDVRAQLWLLVAVLAVGTAAGGYSLRVADDESAALGARRQVIAQVEESARLAQIEALIQAFGGSADRTRLEVHLREIDGGLTALGTGDAVRQLPPAPATVGASIEQAQLIWAQERARLLQGATSVPALREALDDGTSRQFVRALHAVDIRFEAVASSTEHLLSVLAFAAIACSMVIALTAAVTLLRHVSAPLRRLDQLIAEIEAGNIWARYGVEHPPGMAGSLVRSFDRMVESRGSKAQLEHDALTDELTSLPNRRAFFIALEEIVKEAGRSGGSFDVCFVDVDEFKSINDQFGHAEGDIALQDVAHVLRHRFGESSVIGRLGGDEFAVIYAGNERLSTEGVSTQIALLLAELADTEERICAVEVSVGVCPYFPGDTADSLVQRADRSMYNEKRARAEARARRRGAA